MPTKFAGLGVPNIGAYYKVFILDQAKVWWNSFQQPTWLQIECTAMTVSPKTLLSSILKCMQPPRSFLDTVTATTIVWNAIHQK